MASGLSASCPAAAGVPADVFDPYRARAVPVHPDDRGADRAGQQGGEFFTIGVEPVFGVIARLGGVMHSAAAVRRGHRATSEVWPP